MRIRYDSSNDILSIVFDDSGIVLKDLGDGVLVEYSAEGTLTQVKICGVQQNTRGQEIFRQIVMDGIHPFDEKHPLIIVPRLFEGSQLLD